MITPERVAELLMLRADMPRSLLACMNEVVSNLRAVRQRRIRRNASGAPASCMPTCSTRRIDDILATACTPT